MADYWIILTPENPSFVPDRETLSQAEIKLREIFPTANEIKSIITDKTVLYSSSYFFILFCPNCKTELSIHWWHEILNKDLTPETEYKLAAYQVPCCRSVLTPQELSYDWGMGFARFALQITSLSSLKLENKDKEELERILGVKLRDMYGMT